MKSPFPLSISPTSAFLSYFEKLLSSSSQPLRVDSTHFLVTINSLPFCLLFPSILSLPPLTSPIPPAFQLRLVVFYLLFHAFAFLFETCVTFHCLLHLLFTNNQHFLLNVTILYLPWHADALPNHTKLMNYS